MAWPKTWFLHGPIDAGSEATVPLPAGTELDRWEGAAWLTLAVQKVALPTRRFPLWPPFLAANLRTYVHTPHGPGVHFVSLTTTSRPYAWAAARLAEKTQVAPMRMTERAIAIRPSAQAPGMDGVAFAATLTATSTPRRNGGGPPSAWLLERYRASSPDGALRLRVRHPPWSHVPGEATVHECGLLRPWASGDPALVHVAGPVQAWATVQVMRVPRDRPLSPTPGRT